VALSDGRRLKARAVVAASGARYRRPVVPRLGEFEGRGVWYWASAIEARMCAQTEVALVGGGNSARQAAVFSGAQRSAGPASSCEGLAQPPACRATIDPRIEARPTLRCCAHTELAALHDATGGLEGVTWRNRRDGTETQRPMRNFLFVRGR
jgi:thioredoxin reductase (NADPH)